MTILLGVDGTGPASNSEYATEFAHSFVRRIWWHSACRQRAYLPRPAALGGATLGLAQRGHRWLIQNRQGDEPVLLTGYSRGAAIVVYVAQRLREEEIPVHDMMLFDCVDRAIDIDATVIPDNVADVLHVMRDPASGSRESFGNAGTRLQSATATHYERRVFMGTHGAMGGVPWQQEPGTPAVCNRRIDEGYPDWGTNITYDEDAATAQRIWHSVRPYLRRMHFIG